MVHEVYERMTQKTRRHQVIRFYLAKRHPTLDFSFVNDPNRLNDPLIHRTTVSFGKESFLVECSFFRSVVCVVVILRTQKCLGYGKEGNECNLPAAPKYHRCVLAFT